jgi:hypothetical protein
LLSLFAGEETAGAVEPDDAGAFDGASDVFVVARESLR